MAANTHVSDVNEILLGFFVAGKKWDLFTNATEVKNQHDNKRKLLTDEEYARTWGHAEKMAEVGLDWAKKNGYTGKIDSLVWCARPGSMAQFIGEAVDQKKNPSDIVIKFSSGQFLGLSAKATKRKTDIGFKNPGIGTLDRVLKLRMVEKIESETTKWVKKFNLPQVQSQRKPYIRKNPTLQEKTQKIGTAIIMGVRDELIKKLKSMNTKDQVRHFETEWLDSSAPGPRYIKITGMGNTSPYSAKVDDPYKNEKLDALKSPGVKITFEIAGEGAIGIAANGKKIFKMRAKYESEKFASSIKFSGESW